LICRTATAAAAAAVAAAVGAAVAAAVAVLLKPQHYRSDHYEVLHKLSGTDSTPS